VRLVVGAAVAVLALAAGGCSSYQGSTLSSQLSSWNSATSFWSQVRTVLADATRVGEVEGRGDAAAVRTDCVVLSNDTRGAYQLLPTPAPTLTAGLDQALQLEQSAAGDCYKGASGDASLATRADDERARGAVALGAAGVLYDRLTSSAGGGS
jgi:hypothetical protein